ncbi:LacI family DNA-binding transcriptional regulator [Agromyces sp. NPDC049794]|uniref:LacI family DNA-binding transcriptional regulator n=1 Tax=unclassified Agromyces TaxID=2639701 RepID=UPI0033C95776
MVTSHDVARLAGVSQPTVSRALRGMSGASPETIARVRAAAEALGYVPSEAGRTLSTRRTRCIGIVAGDLTNPFYPELIEPMRAELENQGYRALLIPDADESPVEIERLSDGTLDGVLLTTSTVHSQIPRELAKRGIPFVLVNRTVDGAECDTCAFDNASGAVAASRLLLDRGHRVVGMIGGPSDTSTGRDRAQAFLDEMSANGAWVDPMLVHRGPFSFMTGYRAALELMSHPEPPTAVFCGNDVIALGASDAILTARRDRGRGMEVVGFDDIAMSSWDVFRITTVHGDLGLMARESVKLVLRRIEDPEAPFVQTVLPTTLVDRFPPEIRSPPGGRASS